MEVTDQPLVLLVEDSEFDVDLFGRALASSNVGWQLEVRRDGEAALRFLEEMVQGRRRLPDLMIVDINLPKRNGRQLLAEVKARPVLKRIPFLIYSGTENMNDVVEATDENANAFLRKPVLLSEIEQVIQSVNAFWFSHHRLRISSRGSYEA